MKNLLICIILLVISSCALNVTRSNNVDRYIKIINRYTHHRDVPLVTSFTLVDGQVQHAYVLTNNQYKRSFSADSTLVIRIPKGTKNDLVSMGHILALLIEGAKDYHCNTNALYLETQILADFCRIAGTDTPSTAYPLWLAYKNIQARRLFRNKGREDIIRGEGQRFITWWQASYRDAPFNVVLASSYAKRAMLFANNHPAVLLVWQGVLASQTPSFIDNTWLLDHYSSADKILTDEKFSQILQNYTGGELLMDSKIDQVYHAVLDSLVTSLIAENVPRTWIMQNIKDERFELYHKVKKYFDNMAEHRVQRQEHSQDWYMQHFGVTKKARLAKDFISENIATLRAADAQFGVDYQLIVAILGMETNFAKERYKGKFYTFGSLVSQYILLPKRRNFALRQLKSLYQFSSRTSRDTYYFIGSFAGACGWGQFIPSSLEAFFIDAGGDSSQTDIYSVADNIFSIANYLHKHGLNAQTMGNQKSREKAVYAYNHSDAYVQAVLYIYNDLKENK